MAEHDRQPTGSAITPLEAQTLGDAIEFVMKETPEMQSRRNLNRLRMTIISACNSAMNHPEYKHMREIEDETISALKSHNFGSGPIARCSIQDWTLGANYVQNKRGTAALSQRAMENIGSLLQIGKRVREEMVFERLKDIEQRNNTRQLLTSSDVTGAVISGGVNDMLGEIREKTWKVCAIEQLLGESLAVNVSEAADLTNMRNVLAWQQPLRTCNAWLQFAEAQGLTIEEAKRLIEKQPPSMRLYLDSCKRNGWISLGLSELSLFARVFCKIHGANPTDHFVIPTSLLDHFMNAFAFRSGEWKFHAEINNSLKEACEHLYPGQPNALFLLRRTLRGMEEKINQRDTKQLNEERNSPLRLRKQFPNHAVQDDNMRTMPMIEWDNLTLEKCFDRKNTQKDSLSFPAGEIAAMTDDELQRLAQRHPGGLEWLRLFIEKQDPSIIEQIIHRLFNSGIAITRALGCDLLCLHLSLQLGKAAKKICFASALDTNSKTFDQQIQRYHPRMAAFLPTLTAHQRQYCINCIGHKYGDVDIDNWLQKKSLARVVTMIEQAPHPPLFSLKHWHPLSQPKKDVQYLAAGLPDADEDAVEPEKTERLKREADTLITLASIMEATEQNQMPQTLDYVIRHFLRRDVSRWIYVLSANAHTAYFTNCLRSLLHKIPPDIAPQVIAGSAASLLQESLLVANREFFADYLDVPIGILLERSGKLRSTIAIFRTCRSQLARVEEYVKTHANQPLSDLCPHAPCTPSETGGPPLASYMLTTQTTLTETDLPFMLKLCELTWLDCNDLLRRRAATASPEITRQIYEAMADVYE